MAGEMNILIRFAFDFVQHENLLFTKNSIKYKRAKFKCKSFNLFYNNIQ